MVPKTRGLAAPRPGLTGMVHGLHTRYIRSGSDYSPEGTAGRAGALRFPDGAVIELGKANPENNLNELADGWKFTAQGLRDSYDAQYWR